MTKFQKIQLAVSILVYWSTIFIAIITMIQISKKHHGTSWIWVRFGIVLAGTMALSFFVTKALMTGLHPVLNYIAAGMILSVANVSMVKMQKEVQSNN